MIVGLLRTSETAVPTGRSGDILGAPAVKTLSFHSKWCRFEPWSGNQDPTMWSKKSFNKKTTAETSPKRVGEEGREGVEEAGVSHMLVTSDPERKRKFGQ